MIHKIPPKREARGAKAEDHQGPNGPRRNLSRRRLRFFRWIGVLVVPVFFLGLLEVSLRVAGYGHPAGVTVRCTADGVARRGDNVKFGWRFFPRSVARECR